MRWPSHRRPERRTSIGPFAVSMSNSPRLPSTLIGPLDARALTPPVTSSSEIGPLEARAASVPEKPDTPIGPFIVSTSIDAPSGAVTMS